MRLLVSLRIAAVWILGLPVMVYALSLSYVHPVGLWPARPGRSCLVN